LEKGGERRGKKKEKNGGGRKKDLRRRNAANPLNSDPVSTCVCSCDLIFNAMVWEGRRGDSGAPAVPADATLDEIFVTAGRKRREKGEGREGKGRGRGGEGERGKPPRVHILGFTGFEFLYRGRGGKIAGLSFFPERRERGEGRDKSKQKNTRYAALSLSTTSDFSFFLHSSTGGKERGGATRGPQVTP